MSQALSLYVQAVMAWGGGRGRTEGVAVGASQFERGCVWPALLTELHIMLILQASPCYTRGTPWATWTKTSVLFWPESTVYLENIHSASLYSYFVILQPYSKLE